MRAGTNCPGTGRPASAGALKLSRVVVDAQGMRRLSPIAFFLAVMLIPASFGLAALGRGDARDALDRSLTHEAAQQREALEAYFERARAIVLLTGHDPAFSAFYRAPGTRRARIAANGREVVRAKSALVYLESLYPESIGEACFIDRGGAENARAVRGSVAPINQLSADETGAPFFAPTFSLRAGQVHQTRPYVSPDTKEWVIANATPIPGARRARAIVHFEVTVESFRKAAARQSRYAIQIVDAGTGRVVIDSQTRQAVGARLGKPGDRRFAELRGSAGDRGVAPAADGRAAYDRLRGGRGNANDWLIVASSSSSPALMESFGAGSLAMLILSALMFLLTLANARAGNLRAEAQTDGLTGLANRRQFLRRLERSIGRARRKELAAALLMIDLDRFKELNDTLGHHIGDLLLHQVARRLQDSLHDADTLARLGGDEFAILLSGLEDGGTASRVAERIQEALGEPFALEGLIVPVDASIGIALFPDHGQDSTDLLQRADVAMYQAKQDHSGWELYDGERDLHSRDRLALVGELHNALRENQLVLHYQPKADLEAHSIIGVEALVRWDHPTRGLVYPDTFVAVAEQAGFMRQMTAYVLDAALAQTAAWREDGLELTMAVNVSATDLMDARFPDEVAGLLAHHGVPAESLQLEVTENTIMSDPERALESLRLISDTGVSISLDDYGTGYSSLAYVKRLPIRELKIDRSFVFNMDTDPKDAMIVRSTIELASNLGICVVAEGVETEATWATLRDMGATLAQGYLLTKALPADDLVRWLDSRGRAGRVPRTAITAPFMQQANASTSSPASISG